MANIGWLEIVIIVVVIVVIVLLPKKLPNWVRLWASPSGASRGACKKASRT